MVHTQEGIESAIGAWDGALASYFGARDLALDRKVGRSNNADQIRRFRELLGLFLANADPTIWLVSDVSSQVRTPHDLPMQRMQQDYLRDVLSLV